MKQSRKQFIKYAGMVGFGITGAPMIASHTQRIEAEGALRPEPLSSQIPGMPAPSEPGADSQVQPGQPSDHNTPAPTERASTQIPDVSDEWQSRNEGSIIGHYGPWASKRKEGRLPALSLRRGEQRDLDSWRTRAREKTSAWMQIPDIGERPEVTVRETRRDGDLLVKRLSWQLPYGRPTEGWLIHPADAEEPLPGVLALHEHGAQKYFGAEKIVSAGEVHPVVAEERKHYYEGRAWANELARRGYVVLAPDAFTFGQRRVLLADVPPSVRQGLDPEAIDDRNTAGADEIAAYNRWASQHEHIMAKSLFSAGLTWPGVFFAEDRVALDILSALPEVDEERLGCGGLSGGGIRTVYMAGLDPRIKCSVCAGFMSTWQDLVLNKSYTHTWMTYVPGLPNDLDFPEILGMRAPLPTLVLNSEGDPLFTLEGMRAADDILGEVYQRAGAADSYRCSFYPGGHKFDILMQEEAFDWFDRWLA